MRLGTVLEIVRSGHARLLPAIGREVLNLWAAATEGCGRLPDPDEMSAQLGEAGFVEVRARSLIPGDRYYAFVGETPS